MERCKHNYSRGMPKSCSQFFRISPKLSVFSFMGYLKGKSSVMIYQKWEIWSINIETGNFGVEVIMLIQLVSM